MDVASLTIEKVHHDADRFRDVLVRLRLDDEPDRPLPALGRGLVHGRLVDLVFELPRPLVGESFDRHDFLLLRSAVTTVKVSPLR